MTKNNTIIRSIIFLGVILTSVFSCKTETKSEVARVKAELSVEDLKTIDDLAKIQKPDTLISPSYESLNTNDKILTFLREREQYCWDYLAFAEKTKYTSVDRLIKEISFNNSHDPSDLLVASELSEKLKSLYMTRESLLDPEKNDNDSLNDVILQQIFAIGDSTANMNNQPLFQELKKDIMLLNNDDVVSRRTAHSTAVNQLNMFIEENKTALEAEGLDITPVIGWY